jgi:hypothetical protein
MTPWRFLVDRGEGAIARVTFYAHTQLEAVRLAETWAHRLGYEIEPESAVGGGGA